MRDRSAQLLWVQKNRGPRADRTHSAGKLVLEFARALGETQVEGLGRLAEVVAQIVDVQFREHCRVAEVREGVLRVCVDEPGLIPVLRMKWAESLPGELRKRRARPAVREVRFEHGGAGATIKPPTLNAQSKNGTRSRFPKAANQADES